MKAFSKLEQFINSIINGVMAMLGKFIKKKTPKNVSEAINSSKKKLGQTKEQLKDKTAHIKGDALLKINESKVKAIKFTQKAQGDIDAKVKKAKGIDYKKLNYLALFLSFLGVAISPFIKLKSWLIILDPKLLLGITTGSMVAGLMGISIYTNTQKIADKKGAEPEVLAEKVENATAGSRRKAYFQIEEKNFRITNVSMPIYVGDSKQLRTLTIDFTIVGSNRYIKEYFSKNRYVIKDKMYSTIEPIVPEFPLQNEGKGIIKNKLKKELNSLLKDMHIKGSIQDIHVHSILAG